MITLRFPVSKDCEKVIGCPDSQSSRSTADDVTQMTQKEDCSQNAYASPFCWEKRSFEARIQKHGTEIEIILNSMLQEKKSYRFADRTRKEVMLKSRHFLHFLSLVFTEDDLSAMLLSEGCLSPFKQTNFTIYLQIMYHFHHSCIRIYCGECCENSKTVKNELETEDRCLLWSHILKVNSLVTPADLKWCDRLTELRNIRIHLETQCSFLSTLGGAYSCVGDKGSKKHAIIAGKIAIDQLKLAYMLNDDLLKLYALIYIAYSLLQQRKVQKCCWVTAKVLEVYLDRDKFRCKETRLENMLTYLWTRVRPRKNSEKSSQNELLMKKRSAEKNFDDASFQKLNKFVLGQGGLLWCHNGWKLI